MIHIFYVISKVRQYTFSILLVVFLIPQIMMVTGNEVFCLVLISITFLDELMRAILKKKAVKYNGFVIRGLDFMLSSAPLSITSTFFVCF